jgi:acyl carrier protein
MTCPGKRQVDNLNVDLFLVQGKFDMSVNEEVFSKVQSALVDALGVDDDEVTPEATIVGDLEAESIDFLDIVFKLEKAFGIKIQTEELFPKDILTEGTYVQDGKVNSNGLSELKRRMPWADLSKFEANPRIQDFGDLLTVSDLCRYVQSKLA